MWIDTQDCIPLADGLYLAQTIFGEVKPIYYTHAGGFNTNYDSNGNLQADLVLDDDYITHWFLPPKPPKVTAERLQDYIRKEEEDEGDA